MENVYPESGLPACCLMLIAIGKRHRSRETFMTLDANRKAGMLYLLPVVAILTRWLMALPVLCLLLAASYFSQLAQQQTLSIMLFLIGIAVCLVCWMAFDWWVALTAALPLIFGYLTVRTHFAGNTPAAN
jgi:hypothetical protein